MPKIGRPNFLRALPAGLLIALSVFFPRHAHAQKADVPPVSEDDPNDKDRIVAGRPSLYWLKQNLHPISWLEAGFAPLLRVAGKLKFDESPQPKGRPVSGIKFGVRGHGQGSGLGPEIKPYHRNLFNRGIEAELPLSVTYNLYESAKLNVGFPLAGDSTSGKLRLAFTGLYTSRPSENFFGIGNDSSRSNESEFRSVSREAGASLTTRIFEAWTLQAGATYRSVGITQPREFRSAADVFATQNIAGLSVDPAIRMLTTSTSLERDTRDDVHLPTSGGLQHVEARLNNAQRGGNFSYWSYEGQIQQSIPLNEDHSKVIGLRGNLETAQPKGGSTVPFFDLPVVGSYSTVRGYQPRRFTDRSAVSASVEYRYRIWRHMDWGLFVDGGQVAPEIGNFAWDRLHTGYGMRFVVRPREHQHRAIVFDFAHSREEPLMLYVDFSPLF